MNWSLFFQESSGNESSFLIRMNNLAAHVSMRYCFRLEDNHPSHIPLNTRYLSLVEGKYENLVIFEAIDRTKFLRTILALDHESRHLWDTELQNLLSKLQFLLVLSLSHYHIIEIPDQLAIWSLYGTLISLTLQLRDYLNRFVNSTIYHRWYCQIVILLLNCQKTCRILRTCFILKFVEAV